MNFDNRYLIFFSTHLSSEKERETSDKEEGGVVVLQLSKLRKPKMRGNWHEKLIFVSLVYHKVIE